MPWPPESFFLAAKIYKKKKKYYHNSACRDLQRKIAQHVGVRYIFETAPTIISIHRRYNWWHAIHPSPPHQCNHQQLSVGRLLNGKSLKPKCRSFTPLIYLKLILYIAGSCVHIGTLVYYLIIITILYYVHENNVFKCLIIRHLDLLLEFENSRAQYIVSIR